ncbi:MAG: HEAT repeat domain-containing protein, partial [Planctomycetales bacterium]|nr:HEAT repeat domain-containing protein [Planctomycetales bacterium]
MFWVRQRGKLRSVSYLVLCSLAAIATRSPGSEHTINGKTFQLPDGLTLEVAAPADLVARPICCDFDPQGRLYVAEASGTNDPVGKQLEDKPHRIVRLVDKDQDGNFDQRTIFADNMMFPEGTLWHDGSLYVAAPPVIWKLTDTDDDGIADEREPWFDAKTLTGCANDLHGPYLGRDGWIYWCKGAFAEQTYDRQGKTWTTSAAHIFRRHPATGQVEPVMTGGMDNPVEVVFLPSGERLFTTTFLQHPGGGRRDGIIHAIYGGVYGKDHGVLDGHPRTGDLMPVLVHLGPAAPCGLLQLESPQLGQDYDGDLLCCSFNMHKLTRHKLQRDGATYQSHDEDFLVSKDLDFHPTDVIEDADGSLLVIDTGGWYKLCCPSSQLWKPDVLGCIYRIRATDHAALSDPRGGKLSSVPANAAELAQRLADQRPAVRANTIAAIAHVGQHTNAVHWLGKILRSDQRPNVRLQATWSLARIGTREALSALHPALHDQEVDVRQAAIHAVGLHRDAGALAELHHCL